MISTKMNNSLYKTISALLVAGACFASVSAQSLTESLTVVGKYTPEVIAADRLSVSPSMISLSAPRSLLSSDLTGVSANFAPDALGMPATAWRASKVSDQSRGYLNLRLGSWMNSSLSAGVQAVRNENTGLNFRFQHNSTSLWQAWTLHPAQGVEYSADTRFRYDETVGADLCHRFAGAGTLAADLQYHLAYFNYYATDRGEVSEDRIRAPKQTINDIYARVGWEGTPYGKLTYGLNADVRYFGFRAFYLPLYTNVSDTPLPRMQGERETLLNVGGNVEYRYNDVSAWGVGLEYSGVFNHIEDDVNRLRVLPGYDYRKGNVGLHIGAELAYVHIDREPFYYGTTIEDPSGKNTRRLRVAPDVRFDARSGIAAFSAAIGGGTHLRTLAWAHQMNYYGSPQAGCRDVAYSPIDASMAFTLNPGGRWSVGFEALWRTSLNESCGGFYQLYLNSRKVLPDWEYDGDYQIGRLAGFSVGVSASCDFCRYFSLKAKGNWQPQHDSRGILNGFDRPALTAGVCALSRPTDALSLRLDYNLRAKRYLLDGNISRLNLAADYMINEKLSVGAEFNNLLNRHEMIFPKLPSEALTVNLGFQLLF